MLMGIWKNIEELEECINIDELQILLEAVHDREKRQQQFAAALKGINLDSSGEDAKDKFDEIKLRAESRLTGKTEDELSFDDFGIDIETF